MIGCIIQARMGSSRLPGKVMKKIDGDIVLLEYVIEQLKFSKKIDKIIIATTELKEDDIICNYLSAHKIEFYRGSSENVLDRYYQCAKKFSINIIVRITADNPLIDPNIVNVIIDDFQNHQCDFATNTIMRTYPYGTEVEVFSFESLEKSWQNAILPSDKEHVTPFIRNTENHFKLFNRECNEDLSHLRYTVDRIEDLELVKEIIKNIEHRPITLEDIMNLYGKKSEIFGVNLDVKHDGYSISLEKDKEFLKTYQVKRNENEKN